MAITIICPYLKCRSVLQVPDNVRGQKVRCSRCGKNFVVPGDHNSKKKTKPADQPS